MDALQYHEADGTRFHCNNPAQFLLYLAKYANKGPVMIETTPHGLVVSDLVCIEMVAAAPLGAAALSFGG